MNVHTDAEAPGQPRSAATDSEHRERRGRRACILVVEDEEAIRRVATRALERCGYLVVDAASGREALELLMHSELSVDLVVADLTMPEMGGAELCRAAKELGVTPPFLFTSGHGLGAIRDAFDANDLAAFLTKPWTLVQLQRKVGEVLAKHESASDASQVAA